MLSRGGHFEPNSNMRKSTTAKTWVSPRTWWGYYGVLCVCVEVGGKRIRKTEIIHFGNNKKKQG